ncbi:MAG: hypothetical protein K0S68_894 [Candidatus Saccharibacteria bacterium]|jgi:hypothetical protein|nr:hypothetical protein [Candidatus Saccharibacteria bacterium]
MSSTLRRFVAIPVLSIVALIVLGACGSDAESAPDTPPSTSASAPASTDSSAQSDEPAGTTIGDPIAVDRKTVGELDGLVEEQGDKIVCSPTYGDSITVKVGGAVAHSEGLSVKAAVDEIGDVTVTFIGKGEVYGLDTGVVNGAYPYSGGRNAPPAAKSLLLDVEDFEGIEAKTIEICGVGK